MSDANARALVYAGWITDADRRVRMEARAQFYAAGGTLDQFVRVYCDLARMYYR